MRKLLLIMLLSLLVFSYSNAQNLTASSAGLIQKADSLYEAKAYKESAFTYADAFKTNGWIAKTNDRYNAACSWALAAYPDSAFNDLQIIATSGNYINYDHIIADEDLITLRSDSRWAPLIKKVRENLYKAEANYNKPLVAELKDILKKDQTQRLEIDSVSRKFGYNSPQIEALWKEIGIKDSVNLIKVENILDKYGWLGPDIVGNSGSLTLFLVIQHSDQQIQEKYLPMMRDAVKNGKALAGNLALLEDRVALEEGRKQIYGSQIGRDVKTGKSYVRPIEDEANVDKRRASVGLPPLAAYARQWGIDYKLPKQ